MSDLKVKDPKNPSGPTTIRSLVVHIDRDLCIGAATCAAVAPKAFHIDDEAKAIILDTVEEETDEAIIEAARSCPVAAIIVKNIKGERVFPK